MAEVPTAHRIWYDREGCECGEVALRAAKERLASMHVVLMLDWLHLSGPLLCQRLGGGFCSEGTQAELSKQVPNCGGRLTLEAEGLGELADAWEEANDLDYEVYAFARNVARQQLAGAGVHVGDAAPLEKKVRCRAQQRGDGAVGYKACPVKPDPWYLVDKTHTDARTGRL